MREKFGNTWWGRKWLGALSSIDESNRLPRGRRYAANGSVLKLQITENRIEASVKGSQPIPYGVKIEVPLFESWERDALRKAIRQDPYLLSGLLNRELPEELLDITYINEIQLFPEHWDDLDMRCSCPDWAVPCKHLAAIVYLVANEIDRNPFLIFQLHGFDILTSFLEEDAGSAPSGLSIPTYADLFAFPRTELNTSSPKESSSGADLSTIDMSILENLEEQLPVLLEGHPLFYQKDFKEELVKAWKKIRRGVAKRKPESGKLLSFRNTARVAFMVEEQTGAIRFLIYPDHAQDQPEIQPIPDLAVNLAALEPDSFQDYLPVFGWLKNLLHFSVRLVESAAYTPQLIKLQKDTYHIRWVPALLNEQVADIFDGLVAEMPQGLVYRLPASGEPVPVESSPSEEALSICAAFLGWFVAEFSGTKSDSDKVKQLFFTGQPVLFDHFTENELAGTIQNWLSPFYLHIGDFGPVLHVLEGSEGDFQIQVLVENKKDPESELMTLSTFLREDEFSRSHTRLVRSLAPLLTHLPELKTVIRSRGEKSERVSAGTFARILIDILPVMRLFGISILLPKALQHWIRPQATVRIQSGGVTEANSLLKLQNMLNFNWQVALGDTVVTPEEFLKMVEGLSGLVKIRGQYVLIQKEELAALKRKLEDPPKLDQRELLQTALAEEYLGQSISLDDNTRVMIREMLDTGEVVQPEGLLATLRPYQERGYAWMYRNARIGLGSIIADDMGLGKTLQVICLLLKLKQEGNLEKQKALAIVPTTLLTNWQKEIEKFTPELQSFIYHGPTRKFSEDPYDLCLTTYGVLRSDIKEFGARKWKLVVIDEAQNIKNPSAAQTKAVKKLKSDIRIAMSGTPVENRLSEYWSIMDFVNKGYLGGLSHFKDHFGKPIQIYHDQARLETFRKITAPFIMRRLKTDKSIISDLPEKIQNDRFCALSEKQGALYQSIVEDSLKEIERQDGIQRGGLVLKLMMALKQVCNHPVQYLKKGTPDPTLSGKAELLMELLETIHATGEKVLIFTQFREMGELLVEMIREIYGRKPQFLHGGSSRAQRDHMVETFQNDPREWVFLLSLKAGGTGLNLTAASHVIHYDLWWNPAVEAQATDRAYRIGQNKNVMVYRLISKGTMEEKIDEMITRKKQLADLTVATGEKWIGELSDGELRELVELG